MNTRWMHDLGFINMGWFTWTEALKISNTYPVAQYSFVLKKERPPKQSFPWEHQQTKYIGMAGGTCCDVRFDDKKGKKNGKGGQVKTPPLDRLQDHGKSMIYITEDIVHTLDPKYQDWYWESRNNPDCVLWINLFVPDINTPSSITQTMRPHVSLMEAESIYLYHSRWGNAPMMNRAHRWDLASHEPDSVSATVIAQLQSQATLTSFFESSEDQS